MGRARFLCATLHVLVVGIEPTTSGLLDQHSNRLSYTSFPYTLIKENVFILKCLMFKPCVFYEVIYDVSHQKQEQPCD